MVLKMENENRLINANTLAEKFRERKALFLDRFGGYQALLKRDKSRVDELDNCLADVINAQTVDAVEVVHGWWDEIEEEVWHLYKRWPITRFRCSQCKQMENKKSNYCPNCGAKMTNKE